MTDFSYVTDGCVKCGRINRPKSVTFGVGVLTRYVCVCGYFWRTSWDVRTAEQHDEFMRREGAS